MTDDDTPEWGDLDTDELLVGILTQLEHQNRLLSQLVANGSDDTSDETDSPARYECQFCGETVVRDGRCDHLRDAHGYVGGREPEQAFEPVDTNV